MFETDFQKIFKILRYNGYVVYGPVKTPEGIFIRELEAESEADYSGKCPADSWKRLFYPPSETLFSGQKDKFAEAKNRYPKIALWGINVLDLKALALFDLMLANDPYYMERRKNVFVVGFSPKPLTEYQNFSFRIHVDILEHLNYDLFILKKGGFKLYAASDTAEKILKRSEVKINVRVYLKNLIYQDELVDKNQKLLEKSKDHPVWKVLNERCIACGKCSVVCPTCYCFDLIDTAHPEGSERKRVWGDCFYSEFTRIAGNYIFLKNPGEKLFYWYTHKFSRVPAQTGFPGCVGCRRCYEVCPVFIDIEETLADLATDKAKKSTR
jgi:formate hydrogenlyase subunit 6/NADH:ubiquinone oxidoreductase subunit I